MMRKKSGFRVAVGVGNELRMSRWKVGIGIREDSNKE